MKTRFDGFCAGKREQHGAAFSKQDLDPSIVPHYNAGQQRRIKVRWNDGSEQWGCVGVTTGWKPVFLLMRNRLSRGSSDCLRPGSFAIVAYKDLKN